MSDPVILAITAVFTALIAGAPATIAAIAALRQGQKNAEKTAALDVKAEALIVGVKEVHTLANSTNSNLTKANEVQAERVLGLEKMVASLLEREKIDLARQLIPASAPAPKQVVDANGDTDKGPYPKPAAPALVDPQGDRIEETGKDTNERVQKVEAKVVKVENEVGEKLKGDG